MVVLILTGTMGSLMPCTKVKSLSRVQLFVAPCDPPGSSVHGIFEARILEWVAISFFRGSSWPRGIEDMGSNPRFLCLCIVGNPENPPANAGDMSWIPGPGRSHMPQSNDACVPQLLSLCNLDRSTQKDNHWCLNTDRSMNTVQTTEMTQTFPYYFG